MEKQKKKQVEELCHKIQYKYYFCGNFISAISAVHNDTADLKKTAEN
jgi:hypothetical protein